MILITQHRLTNGTSNKWDCLTNGKSEKWDVQQMGCLTTGKNINPITQKKCLTNGMSDKWASDKWDDPVLAGNIALNWKE